MKRFIPLLPGLKISTFWQKPKRNYPFPLNQPHYSFYFARNGIWWAFKSFNLTKDDEVLIPAYNSGTEEDTLDVIGVKKIYYDVDRNCQINIQELEKLVTAKTRALYLIHYFGLAQNIPQVLRFCQKHNLILFEDCALAFLSNLNNDSLGSFGQASIFCLRKFLQIPNGGTLLIKSHQPKFKYQTPSRISTYIEFLGLIINNYIRYFPWLSSISLIVKRLVKQIFKPWKTDSGDKRMEIDKVTWNMSGISKYILRRLDYQRIIKTRVNNYFYLKHKLKDIIQNTNKIKFLTIQEQPGFVPFCLPLLVDDNIRWSARLKKYGIEAGAWWRNDSRYQLKQNYPNNLWLRKHILELPVHQGLKKEDMDFIKEKIENILKS